MLNSLDNKFGLCGDPVKHSLSPKLFAAAYPQSNHTYELFCVATPKEILRLLREKSLDGVNLTAPLKSSILPFASTLEKECRLIGAANLLLKRGEKMIACNFDHTGVSGALSEAGIRLHGAVCLLLGAGGAAKAAAYALLRGGATLLWANRTIEHIPRLFLKSTIASFSLQEAARHLPACNIIVNTLPLSVPDTQFFKFHPRQTVFDASYASRPLERQAYQAGANYIGGERWLLHQAIPSFTAMTKTPPDIPAMEEALKNYLPFSK